MPCYSNSKKMMIVISSIISLIGGLTMFFILKKGFEDKTFWLKLFQIMFASGLILIGLLQGSTFVMDTISQKKIFHFKQLYAFADCILSASIIPYLLHYKTK